MKESKPIRILHVLNSLNRGGAETMLMNYYRKIDRSRFQFDFVVHDIGLGVYADEVRQLGGHIYYVPKFKGYNIFACIRAWQKIFREANDDRIVQGHMPSTAFLYLLLGRMYGRYVIAHAHNIDKNARENIIVHLIRNCLYIGTRFVANQFYGCTKAAGIDRYGEDIVNSNKFTVWHNAIDYNEFTFDENSRNSIRQCLNISDDTLVIGHVGRMVAQKNHKFLLRLFASFHNNNPNTCLMLIGDGKLKNDIINFLHDNDLSDSVHMVGEVDNVGDYLSAMDIFVFPSYYEGLSIVNIEAQINGLKCIVSTGVPSEVNITDNEQLKFLSIDDANVWLRELKNISRVKKDRYTIATNNINYNIEYAVKWAESEYYHIYMMSRGDYIEK